MSIPHETTEGMLAPHSGVPLFHQLTVILRDRIVSGGIGHGALMPSEAQLCADYGVSRITARRALDELAREGLVVRQRGRGTIVSAIVAPPAFMATVDGWMENISRMADTTRVRVLEFGYQAAPAHIALALEIEAGAEVQRSVRVRAHPRGRLSHLETWVPGDIGRTYDDADMGAQSLLRLLERCGVKVASARQTITAVVAPSDVARALGIQAGAPLLDVRRVVRDASGRAVEFIRALYRPDLYQFEMDLRRVEGADGARWAAQAPDAEPGGGPGPRREIARQSLTTGEMKP